MEAIKISVDVNLHLSEDAKTFLAGLLLPKCNHGCGPTRTIAVDNFDPSQENFSQTNNAPEPAHAPEPKPASEPAPAPEPAPASSNVDIEDLRKLVSQKANAHREKIKEELTRLGSPSITKLDPSKYQDMYNFLIAL